MNLRRVAALAAGLAVAGMALPAGAQTAEGAVVGLRMPKGAEVAWRGMLQAEGGGVSGIPMFYPAVPGIAGLLAAVLTHGAISSGSQSARQTKEQEEADKVLEPYRKALKDWPADSLWSLAAEKAMGPPRVILLRESEALAAPVVEALPVFSMAPDEKAIVLDVAVRLQGATATDKPIETTVRVVSSPVEGDARALWSADDAATLKATSAAMLAHAISLLPGQAAAPAQEPPSRTVRYLQGGIERAERGQWLAGTCARAILRTLRGGLMSVPLAPVDGAPCSSDTAF